MFDLTPKPQFHTYPLNKYELTDLNNSRNAIDAQINQNRKQIKNLNNKFNNDQYKQAYMDRLYQKQKMLFLKKQEYDHIMKLNQFHDRQTQRCKQLDHSYKANLAQQYKEIIEQNRKKKILQKRKQQEQQRQILYKNIIQIQKNEKKIKLDKDQIDRKDLTTNFKIQQSLKQKQIEEREKDKKQYNQFYLKNKNIITQKEKAYQNFYSQNKNNISNIQKIYKKAYQPAINQKQQQIIDKQKRNIQNYDQYLRQKEQNQAKDKANRNQQLKNYLETQINRKSIQRAYKSNEKLVNQKKNINSQIDNQEYQKEHKINKHRDQLFYASELDQQMNNQLLHRSFQQDNQKVVGKIYQTQFFHNPISNPISLGIGMTNSYVLKEYQNRQKKYQRDQNRSINMGKYHQLAQIANRSLIG